MKYWPTSQDAPPADDIQRSFDNFVAAASSISETPLVSDNEIQEAARREATGSRVVVDQHGLSEGAAAILLPPVRGKLVLWAKARSGFITQLSPKRADLEAMQSLADTAADLKRDRQSEIDALRQRWDENPQNALIAQQWAVAQDVYQRESQKHGQRLANMAAYTVWYWLGLLCIGVAEWLINYDTFVSFTGIVAIAAGATIILAVLLAFAAHGHGELLKQWLYRFGRFQSVQSRAASWRLLGLASFAVVVVLAAAGGSRYAAVMRGLSQTHQPDMLGGGYSLDIDPLRDVLLSLLANIAAWIVGVFISYFCHDVDPDFMAATYQHRRGGRAFFRARRRLEEDTQIVIARTGKDIGGLENAAKARHGSVKRERDMLLMLEQQDAAISESLAIALHHAAERYRSLLLESLAVPLLKRPTDGGLVPFSIEDYRLQPLLFDRAYVRSLMGAP